MTDIELILGKAREKSEGFGELYGRKETADDFLKVTYAQLYEDTPDGTVGERDAWVKRQPEYIEAISRKRDAYAKWKEAETYMKIVFAEAEVWRTKCANERGMDRAHR